MIHWWQNLAYASFSGVIVILGSTSIEGAWPVAIAATLASYGVLGLIDYAESRWRQ